MNPHPFPSTRFPPRKWGGKRVPVSSEWGKEGVNRGMTITPVENARYPKSIPPALPVA